VRVYYNEIDPFAVAWLRELMKAGAIPPGEIDTRSIKDVQAHDLRDFDQAHFFAGIGGWPYALQLAGWGGAPVWTGSCPCQPFSAAGKRKGTDDPRHLWPEFHRLIAECAPPVIFGEQVASKDGRIWLAGVRADLEALAYGVGAADLCAAGVEAPHIRQRLYWMADAKRDTGRARGVTEQSREGAGAPSAGAPIELGRCSVLGGLDDTASARRIGEIGGTEGEARDEARVRVLSAAGAARYWGAYDVLPCLDGKARRIEPGSFPLAHGVPARVGRLRGYGNAIVPQVAAEFIAAFLAV
jgi:DNA (cytosine-5)-methyltransferase 1